MAHFDVRRDTPFCSLLEQERTLLDTVAKCIGSE